mgnify:FL=1
MKKIIFSATLLLCLVMASCSKDEIGGTATQAVAGEWYVTVEGVDASNKVLLTDNDLFGWGHKLMKTYNTAANTSDEMFLDVPFDLSDFGFPNYTFAQKVSCDVNSLTFQSKTGSTETASISGGQILPSQGIQPNGAKADSIVFYVTFKGDQVPSGNGFVKYKVSGRRYSGLVNND